MEQTSPSLLKKNNQHLDTVYEKKQKRTLELGKTAIDSLIEDRSEITLHNIAEKTKALDPEGKGIHFNTIRTNKELYAYYMEHSKTFKRKQQEAARKSISKPMMQASQFQHLRPTENDGYKRKQYNRLNKNQLINLLLEAENHIAKMNQSKLKSIFETFQ